MAFQSNDVLETHYRALNEQGRIIAESDSIEEIFAMSHGEKVDILMQQERRVVTNWAKIPKEELEQFRRTYYA